MSECVQGAEQMMRPTETFIALIRTVTADNASDIVERMRALADRTGAESAAMRRHLGALAFRLEGNDHLGAAADIYDLIGTLVPDNRERWTRAAAIARLRDLCGRGRFDEASTYVARLRTESDASALIQNGVAILLRLGWEHECRNEPWPCLQCYRLAFELNGGDAGVTTEDGDRLRSAVRLRHGLREGPRGGRRRPVY